MHSRRFTTFLFGAFIVAGILMDFAVIQNFRSVDRFLVAPDPIAAAQIKAMGGKGEARTFLRHEVGELNRFLFEQWERAELVLGVLLVLAIIFGHGDAPRIALFMTLGMLLVVVLDRFWLTPEITRLGRLLDYPDVPGADPALFWRYHGIYSGLELAKLAMGLIGVITLLVRHTDRHKFVREHQKISRDAAPRAIEL
jgi:hypothetical protein